MPLWGETLKATIYSREVLICWSELCDLVGLWSFTVKCFVFKWPWPWWDYCTWWGGVTESVRGWKVSSPFARLNLTGALSWGSTIVHCITFNPIKSFVSPVCSLLTLHLFVHRHLCYSLLARRVLFREPLLLVCLHCLLLLLNADTILHWLVWRGAQRTLKKMVYITISLLKHYISPGRSAPMISCSLE